MTVQELEDANTTTGNERGLTEARFNCSVHTTNDTHKYNHDNTTHTADTVATHECNSKDVCENEGEDESSEIEKSCQLQNADVELVTRAV